MQAVMTQRDVTYEALRLSFSPGASLNYLKGTGPGTSARGMIIVSQAGTRALLLVVDLPPLPSDRVYQVWLIKHGRRYSAGWFTVDRVNSNNNVTEGPDLSTVHSNENVTGRPASLLSFCPIIGLPLMGS